MKEAKNMRSSLTVALADAHLKKDAYLVKGAIHTKTAADPRGTTCQNSEDSGAPIAGVQNLLIEDLRLKTTVEILRLDERRKNSRGLDRNENFWRER